MTPYKRRLNPYIRRMAEDMQLRNLSPSTIDAYTYHVDKFCRHFGKPAEQLGLDEIRQYQLYLVNDKKASWSSFNQAVCGLRFLYEVTLGKPWAVRHIPSRQDCCGNFASIGNSSGQAIIFSLARRRTCRSRRPPSRRRASWQWPRRESPSKPRHTLCGRRVHTT